MPTHASHLYILSGSSRGMGEAMGLQLLQNPAHTVLGLARQESAALSAAALASGAAFWQWRVDLADPLPAAERLGLWLRQQDLARFASLNLINNAGVITAPGALQDTPLAALSQALRVSLEACMLLSQAFLDACRDVPGALRILQISSGLGRRAMAGSAGYCAAKAGMDHLSRAMALDEAHRASQGLKAARIVSLAPGVIDTDMQAQLRTGDPQHFPEQTRFAELKAKDQLKSPAEAAAAVLAYLHRPDFGAQSVADVRES